MNRTGDDPVLNEEAREFERRLGALLVESADALDGRTRSALTQARFAALEEIRPAARVRRGLRFAWAPAGAVAMAFLAVLFYAGQPAGNAPLMAPVAVGVADDIALVSDADMFDLSNDGDVDLDTDFYEWAAAMGGMSDNGLRS